MAKNLRRRKRRKKLRASASNAIGNGRTIQVTFSLDGGPASPDCSCPICVDLAQRGVPLVTMSLGGELIELPRLAPPPMIEVTVRGSVSTWPELSTDRRTVSVPVGSVVQDVLELLRYKSPELQRGFPPGGLSATILADPCEDLRVVCAGDELRVSGRRSGAWDEVARNLVPLPSTT